MYRRTAYWVIAGLVIITLFFAWQLPNLKFNYVFEDFFPVDDPELAYYQKFKETFGEDNDYLLVSVTSSNGVFNSQFLDQITLVSEELSSLEGTVVVRSITNASQPVIGPLGVFDVPVIHVEEPEKYTADSSRLFRQENFRSTLLSEDGRTVLLMVEHDHFTTREGADSYLNSLENILSPFPAEQVHTAGKIYAQRTFITKMQWELMIFLSASMVLIIVFLIVTYRSFWLTILPLLVVFLGAVWILGTMAIAGKQLDILMVLLPTIMFVVGMSDVVHILTKYLEQLRRRKTKFQAIRTTFREVGLATFLTSLTTAVGFFTLLTASIRPIREFGLYTGIGVFMAFIAAFALMPAALLLMRKPVVARKLEHRSRWFVVLGQGFIQVLRRRNVILIISVILIGLSFVGIQKIYINTYLIEDLPNDDPLKEDFTFFDENFGGSRPFEMTVETGADQTVFNPAVVQQIVKVEKYLNENYGTGVIVSPATVVKSINQAINGGSPESFSIPDSESGFKRLDRYLKRYLRSGRNASNLVTEDQRLARISSRIEDEGSAITLAKTEQLRQFIRQETDTSLVRFTVTGTSNLIDKNNEYLAQNMFLGLAIAFAVVAIIAGILFRSLRMVAITLIPNIIPLMMVAAIMGFFGITLKLSTSIVFTIAFGIAVDDTIHFISKLKLELEKNKSLIFALKRTYLSTGKAIIVTSIILSGGFLILLLSSFGGTFYTGLLISLTLVFALITDLTLLPVLILLFFRRDNPKKRILFEEEI
ncbi:efflux RND transporter permease subunit [Fulvivirga sedimenti]|uniref:MMPL family transporter n=1 Tax=Fulvivirga sedimenti TaxID=2879465 RepID=A0A9X1HXA2_9BACT|nr:MMPL family transporter [Fulvivirga sedimenti]MCA6078743.1 MMPL family transporter [Fulvivirga sedimenti]